ncbi:Cullin-3A (AtCUL3a) [Durusdinium trenchii]|uniref:Cullin-3A (AtCUL3a) n=1 Tax=Durusdinium trenchii TaxID=1381693 RepID=A0ABP0RM42_9DINO
MGSMPWLFDATASHPGSIRQFRSGDPMDEKEPKTNLARLTVVRTEDMRDLADLATYFTKLLELYRNAYNLVLHKYGELLYNGVQAQRVPLGAWPKVGDVQPEGVVADHLKIVAQSCIECPGISETVYEVDGGEKVEMKKQWDDHKTTMVMIRDILMYMDRNFVTQYKKAWRTPPSPWTDVVPVYEMGLMIFREKVSGHPRVKTHLLTLMLDNISAERRGEQVDRILLKHTVNMLVELGVQGKNVYRECFEDHFLDHTRKFYQDESKQYISQNPCSDYLKKAEKRIREEKARVENYLHESTMEKIQELCDEEWIQVHYKTLIHMENSGCAWMFQCDKIADLERMYLLFSRVPVTLKEVQKVMMDCMCEAGRDVLNDPEKVKDPVSFITAILSLKYKYDRFVKESFKESKDFQLALKQAFESFLNKDTRTAQYLSLYVDDQFRKGLKGMSSDADVDTALEQVVTVFRFLQDKDVFENFYKQHLSKRLLTGRSVSDEAERSMISKLKRVGSAVSSASSSIDMKAPVGGKASYIDSRKLTWQPQYGAADLKVVSTYQMCILMLFNQQPTWTYQDIRLRTNIPVEPVDELKRHLQSLYVNPKAKILVKLGDGEKKEPEENDQFMVNPQFESKLLRIKVPS